MLTNSTAARDLNKMTCVQYAIVESGGHFYLFASPYGLGQNAIRHALKVVILSGAIVIVTLSN